MIMRMWISMTRRTDGQGADKVKWDGNKEEKQGVCNKEVHMDDKEDWRAGRGQGQARW